MVQLLPELWPEDHSLDTEEEYSKVCVCVCV